MATVKRGKSTGRGNRVSRRQERKTFDHKFVVDRAIEFDDGGISFDLTIDKHIKIYGCRVASGQNGDFVSFPARKGKDGKYYSVAWLPLTDEQSERILDLVSAKLGGLEEIDEDDDEGD